MSNQQVNDILNRVKLVNDSCVKNIENQQQTLRSIEYLHAIVFNLNRELECTTKSLNILLLEKTDEWEARLEKRIESTINKIVQESIKKEISSTVESSICRVISTSLQQAINKALSDGMEQLATKYFAKVPIQNEIQNKSDLQLELEGTTWTCSSQEKLQVRKKRITKNKISKNRNLETSRTIIPWNEISSPPQTNFTSEI